MLINLPPTMARAITHASISAFFSVAVILLVSSLDGIDGERVAAPRGVHPDLVAMYTADATEFQCLDGSLSIPFDQVNDDYCDCEDGSDEPGTSACTSGRFYCANLNHEAKTLLSSRVNDGICDCCDGSDEWASSSGNVEPCANTCMEMGAAAREEALRRATIQKEGFEKKKVLMREGEALKKTRQEELATLQKEREDAQKLESEKEEVKKSVEEAEKVLLERHNAAKEAERQKKEEEDRKEEEEIANKFFSEVDTNQNGVLHVTEIMAHEKFDTNRDGVVSDDEANFFLSGNTEYNLEDFVATGWGIIKSRVLGTDEEKAVVDEAGQKEEVDEDEDLDNIDDEDDYPDYDQGELEDIEHHDDDEDGHVGHVEPLGRQRGRGENVDPDDSENAPTDGVQEPDEFDEETREAINKAEAARSEYEDARSKVKNIEESMEHLKENLETDFGPNQEFASLKGKCFEYNDNEYIYKICPFDYCAQKGKGGGGETRLGKWENFEEDGENVYARMKYGGGQACWNGPARSMIVHLQCGLEEKVVSVNEPAKCTYEMVFETSAVCRDSTAKSHDEL